MKHRSRNTNEKKKPRRNLDHGFAEDLHVVAYELRGSVTVSDYPVDPDGKKQPFRDDEFVMITMTKKKVMIFTTPNSLIHRSRSTNIEIRGALNEKLWDEWIGDVNENFNMVH